MSSILLWLVIFWIISSLAGGAARRRRGAGRAAGGGQAPASRPSEPEPVLRPGPGPAVSRPAASRPAGPALGEVRPPNPWGDLAPWGRMGRAFPGLGRASREAGAPGPAGPGGAGAPEPAPRGPAALPMPAAPATPVATAAPAAAAEAAVVATAGQPPSQTAQRFAVALARALGPEIDATLVAMAVLGPPRCRTMARRGRRAPHSPPSPA